MENYVKLFAIALLCASPWAQGSETTITPGQDDDVKTQEYVFSKKDLRDSKSFWNLYSRYFNFSDPDLQRASIKGMRFILEKNSNVLSSKWKDKDISPETYPLMGVAWVAGLKEMNTSEWDLFSYALSVDLHNGRRVAALVKAGIKLFSVPVVEKLLGSGTNVSQAPEILLAVTDQCCGIDASKEGSVRKDLNKSKLLEIVTLLLRAKADLSGITQMRNRPHLNVDECHRCKLIFDCVDDQREETESMLALTMQNPSAPVPLSSPVSLYPTLTSKKEVESVDTVS